MEDDPDQPDYRYPVAGERLWHHPWRRWVIVRSTLDGVAASATDEASLRVLGEVAVTFEDSGNRAIAKLRNLNEGNAS